MSQYKCVPGPKNLVVNRIDDMDQAVIQFSDLINKHCKDGWDFFSLEEVSVTRRPGCLAGLFGARETTVNYNMLVFKKV
ncbi:MAG TPA: hypothetical protein PKE26_12420 [Kiritimatiellia bacterium]|nr:hypothetical protein [Kiritimatiellia bacterium]HMO99905.1 hypothetical protein [Kiritimatiellia bacterium]HMP96046.1 hypothetical protein [Kiritimatiellia bacterium]